MELTPPASLRALLEARMGLRSIRRCPRCPAWLPWPSACCPRCGASRASPALDLAAAPPLRWVLRGRGTRASLTARLSDLPGPLRAVLTRLIAAFSERCPGDLSLVVDLRAIEAGGRLRELPSCGSEPRLELAQPWLLLSGEGAELRLVEALELTLVRRFEEGEARISGEGVSRHTATLIEAQTGRACASEAEDRVALCEAALAMIARPDWQVAAPQPLTPTWPASPWPLWLELARGAGALGLALGALALSLNAAAGWVRVESRLRRLAGGPKPELSALLGAELTGPERLTPALNSGDVWERVNAVAALPRGESARPALRAAARDPSALVREMAVEALAQRRDAEALRGLAASSPFPRVREAAGRTLTSFAGAEWGRAAREALAAGAPDADLPWLIEALLSLPAAEREAAALALPGLEATPAAALAAMQLAREAGLRVGPRAERWLAAAAPALEPDQLRRWRRWSAAQASDDAAQRAQAE